MSFEEPQLILCGRCRVAVEVSTASGRETKVRCPQCGESDTLEDARREPPTHRARAPVDHAEELRPGDQRSSISASSKAATAGPVGERRRSAAFRPVPGTAAPSPDSASRPQAQSPGDPSLRRSGGPTRSGASANRVRVRPAGEQDEAEPHPPSRSRIQKAQEKNGSLPFRRDPPMSGFRFFLAPGADGALLSTPGTIERRDACALTQRKGSWRNSRRAARPADFAGRPAGVRRFGVSPSSSLSGGRGAAGPLTPAPPRPPAPASATPSGSARRRECRSRRWRGRNGHSRTRRPSPPTGRR